MRIADDRQLLVAGGDAGPSGEERAAPAPTRGSRVARGLQALIDAGQPITMCAWCKRIHLDDRWLLPPVEALDVIRAPFALTHGICPWCVAGR